MHFYTPCDHVNSDSRQQSLLVTDNPEEAPGTSCTLKDHRQLMILTHIIREVCQQLLAIVDDHQRLSELT